MNSLSVRKLAEFVFRHGDLYPTSQGRRVEAIEGIATQQKLQQDRGASDPNYAAEISLKLPVDILDETVDLRGRIDGVTRNSRGNWRIEEYKSTRAEHKSLDQVDYGQCLIYAGLWALERQLTEDIELSVIYVDPDTLFEQSHVAMIQSDEAVASLMFALLCYESRMLQDLQRRQQRKLWSSDLIFPYAKFRPSQRAIARRVYKAQRNKENLLLEACTGSGKTMAVLYSALTEQAIDAKLFFLTSKSSGAKALIDAVKAIMQASRSEANPLVTVQITAREKICIVDGVPCKAQLCEYTKNYYEKLPGALEHFLREGGLADQKRIEVVAKKHLICPFELSLELATWADLIVGDYNYIFDPVVRIQRFSEQKNIHLLVDEAHQLSSRIQSMLEVRLGSGEVRAVKSTKSATMAKRAVSLDNAIRKTVKGLREGEHELVETPSVDRAVSKFLQAYEAMDEEQVPESELEALYFSCLRWSRATDWYDSERFIYLASLANKNITLKQVCLDVGKYAEQVMSEYASVIRFSATVSPLNIYQQLHGQLSAENSFSERAKTPFNSHQSHIIVVKDIPTYYQTRKQSLPKISRLINILIGSKPGRYLLAMPSYAYLEQLRQTLDKIDLINFSADKLLFQKRGQSAHAQQDLISKFCGQDSVIMGVVLGGGLSESIDFGTAKLSGVVVIGIGLPPPSLERNLMARFYATADSPDVGQTMAYIQPAMARVIQAAGRLVRSLDDRGVICLVDPRFQKPQLAKFFPSYWRPLSLQLNQVERSVNSYWAHDTGRLED